MKLPHLVSFALFVVAGVAACGEGKPTDTKASAPANGVAVAAEGATGTTRPTTATPEQTALLADLTSVQVTVCACPDRACVEKAIAAGAPFDRRLDTMYEHESTIPVAVKTEVDAIQKRIEACTTRIGGTNAPLSAATTKVLADVDTLATEICSCSNAACVSAAKMRWGALEDALKATSKPSGDIPEGVVARMAAAQGKAQACVDKLPS